MAANIVVPVGGRAAEVFGATRVAMRLYTGPASYPNTGGTIGDPITEKDLALKGIMAFPGFIAFDPAGGLYRTCVYDTVKKTVRWFVGTTGVEVANGQSLSAYSAVILVYS